MATLKRSVTVDARVLEDLNSERRANLSATVNEGLRLLAALDAQQEAVDAFESEHDRSSRTNFGPISRP